MERFGEKVKRAAYGTGQQNLRRLNEGMKATEYDLFFSGPLCVPQRVPGGSRSSSKPAGNDSRTVPSTAQLRFFFQS